MSIYNLPAKELVYALINEDNPDLPFPVSALNVILGTPQAITPSGGKIQNTRIWLSPVANGDYIGRRQVDYRRIDLSVLFRGMQVQIDKWSPNLPGGTGTTMFTVHQLLADINQKYGLALTTDDVNDQNITRGSTLEGGFYTRTVTVTVKAGSYGYVGSFSLKWKEAPREIDLMIAVSDLAGRQFPGGNVFDVNHPIVLDSAVFDRDFTDKIFELAPSYTKAAFSRALVASGTTLAAFYQYLIGELNTMLGTSLTWTNMYNKWYHTCYTLPNDAVVPEANSRYSNRVIVLETPPEGIDGVIGKVYIHFFV